MNIQTHLSSRVISCLLALLLLAVFTLPLSGCGKGGESSSLTSFVFQDTPVSVTVDDVIFDEYAEYAVITKVNPAVSELTLPSKLGDKPVISIADEACSGMPDLVSVVIPEGVTSIGDRAFSGCRALKTVTFPSTLRSISLASFVFCVSLDNVTLPDGLVSIGQHAFRECSSLKSISIPASVTDMGGTVFAFNSAELNVRVKAQSYAAAYLAENNVPFTAE